MLSLSATVRIWLCAQPTDLRKSFDSLASIVRDAFGGDPKCRLQAEWAPLWETSGYHLSGCGADCSTTLGIKPVRRLDSRPLRDCRADQGRIHSLSGPGPMFR